MAVDMFLKIDGIDGESQDAKHKDEIELLSFSWGATQPGAEGIGGGLGGGKVEVHDFSFVHKIDKASPQLLLNACAGSHIKSAVLSVRKSGDNAPREDYLTIKLSDLLVSSFQAGANGQAGEIPMEQVSLNFAKIEIAYSAQKATGEVGSTVQGSCGGKSAPTFQPPIEKR